MASTGRPLADLLRDVADQLENCSHTDANEFKEFLCKAYPKLRLGGGFELLKISGTTRSRNLSLIPCPNEGYHSSGEVEVEVATESANSSRSEGRFVSMLTRPQGRETTRANNSNYSVPPQGCVPAPEIADLDPVEERGLPGDPAIGDGVTRHFLATVMSKVQYGFEINFVPGGTLLFEGEQDHRIPSTSHILLESDFFVVAGRMIGHSFLHDGPCLGGLSPAILHVLFGGSPEEATIDILDCADLDIREKIKLLEGTAELSSEEKHMINELALSWDLPLFTSKNRRWLLDKLLFHAVLGRTSRQVKQLRRGLKETLIWPLLTERKDTIPLLFPSASDLQCTPRMVLEKIKWPTQDEDEDSDVSLEDTSSPSILGKLLEFWIGWNVLPRHLDVNVVESNFPRSSTCFHLLKLPGHYNEYSNFERDILAAICSTDTGFGMV
ncbi:uncharacterized protein LOC131993938 [Centropristis striata]|uniref:uncharacterized protein LOC131993938 n=1 Tax=Centropristis striata TaxID=184440 RepID=UPI0027DFFD34|nr:uncharacterized protein LOC131993938 [Centropristis striata]